MTTEPLPSGRPWYWRYLEERPEGVYVLGANIRADRVVNHWCDTKGYCHFPNMTMTDVRACLSWWADKETITSTELPIDAPIST